MRARRWPSRIAASCWPAARTASPAPGAELLADPEVAKSFLGGGADDGHAEALPINEFVFFINKGLIAGLIIGSIYALGAVGVTLIFGILRFAHFPHGDMMTLGAFVALILTALAARRRRYVGLPTAFVLMPIAMAVTAAPRHLARQGLLRAAAARQRQAGVIVMASIGVMLMMQGLIRLFAGTGTRQLDTGAKDIYRVAGRRPRHHR